MTSSFHKKDGLPVKANTGGYLRSPLLISSSFVVAAEKFVGSSTASHSSRAASSIWRHSHRSHAEDEEEEGLNSVRHTGGREWTRAGVGAGSLLGKDQRAQQHAVEKVYGSFFLSSSSLTRSNTETGRNEEELHEKASRERDIPVRIPSSSSSSSSSDATGRRAGMPRLFGTDTADRGAWNALQTKHRRAQHATTPFHSSVNDEEKKEEEEEVYAKGGREGEPEDWEGDTTAALHRPPWKRPRIDSEEEEESSKEKREGKWRRKEGPLDRTHDGSASGPRKRPMDVSSSSFSVVGPIASEEVMGWGQPSSEVASKGWKATPTHTHCARRDGGEESDTNVAHHSHENGHTQATPLLFSPTTRVASPLNRMQRIQQMREDALFGKKKKKK